MMFDMAQGMGVPHDDSRVSHSFFSKVLPRAPTEKESISFAKPVSKLNSKRSATVSAEENKEVKKARSKSLQYVCAVTSCGEKFCNVDQLNSHLKLHLGVKPFTCDMCGKVCQTESKLKTHQSSHVNDGLKPVCDICERSFSSRSSLNKHKKMLHKPKPHLCPLCNSGFEEHKYMVIHARRAHNLSLPLEVENLPTQKTVEFDVNCFSTNNASEASKNSYRKSFSIPVNDTPSSASTPLNNETIFQSELHLIPRDDSGIENKVDEVSCKPFNCELCSSTFPSLAYLKQHMTVHENENKSFCQSCTLHFYCQEDLDMHMRLHTVRNQTQYSPLHLESERTSSLDCGKYTCVICKKHFVNLGSLKRHQAKGHIASDQYIS